MKPLKTLSIGIFLAMALCSFTRIVWAIPSANFTYAETKMGGVWQYDYTLFNTSNPLTDAGYYLYDLSFTFNPSAVYSIVQLPTGWDEADGAGFITAWSQNPGAPPVGTDIAPGELLSAFTFQFDYQAGRLPFDVTFFNPSDPGNPFVYSRSATVNEVPLSSNPASIFLLVIGIISAVGMQRKYNTNNKA